MVSGYYVTTKVVKASTNWVFMHPWLPFFVLIFSGYSNFISSMFMARHVNVKKFVL